jgi:hypothetical protein
LDFRGSHANVFASHGISAEALAALVAGRTEEFLHRRKANLEQAVRDVAYRLAAWGWNDRPSLEYILASAHEED